MFQQSVKKLRDPMSMGLAAIDREIMAITQRHKVLLKLEKHIEQQHMEDTDRCLALKEARKAHIEAELTAT